MIQNWYVLSVKPRHEIKVATQLSALNFEVYCPLIKEIRVWSDRKKTIEVPLFKSYVFVRLKEKERQSVFVVPGISRYLFWLGKPALVRDDEIETLQNWLSNDRVDEVTVSKLLPGKEMTINQGAFKDKSAIIQEVGKKRVKLIIPGLGVIVNLKLKELV